MAEPFLYLDASGRSRGYFNKDIGVTLGNLQELLRTVRCFPLHADLCGVEKELDFH